MKIPLNKLNHAFHKKPILVGGMAMEYYNLRKARKDIDLIVDEQDIVELIKKYPDRVKIIYSDLGVCPFEFEIWRSIVLLKYKDLLEGAIDEDEYYVISLEKLLLLKALAMSEEKYLEDTKLVVKKIRDGQYANYKQEEDRIEKIVSEIGNISYIEKIT